MNTSAISSLINLGSGSAAPAKSSGAPSDTQFNQMLSREIADRRSVNEPARPLAKDNQAAPAARPAAKSNDSDDAAADKPTAVDDGNAAPAAEAAPVAAERGKVRTAADEEQSDDAAALAANSDELLALVANLNQAVALPAEPAKKAEPATGSLKQDADTAPGIIAAQTADAAAAPAIAAMAAAATSASASATAPTAPVVDTAQAIGKNDAKPRSAELGKQHAAIAASADGRGEKKEFGVSSAQAKDAKPASDASAAQAESGQKPVAGASASTTELHAAKPAHDAQPAAAPITPFQLAAQQQAPLQQAQQAAAAAAVDKLAPRVGSSGWDQALGQKVVWMVAGEQQSASLTLNPPDLGPLQVVLNVTNSQATVNFTAAQPEVRQALESAVPKLREMLGDAGIQLGQANVSAGTPNNQQGGFGERQQAPRGVGPMADDAADVPVRVGRSQVITGGQGLVDTFA